LQPNCNTNLRKGCAAILHKLKISLLEPILALSRPYLKKLPPFPFFSPVSSKFGHSKSQQSAFSPLRHPKKDKKVTKNRKRDGKKGVLRSGQEISTGGSLKWEEGNGMGRLSIVLTLQKENPLPSPTPNELDRLSTHIRILSFYS